MNDEKVGEGFTMHLYKRAEALEAENALLRRMVLRLLKGGPVALTGEDNNFMPYFACRYCEAFEQVDDDGNKGVRDWQLVQTLQLHATDCVWRQAQEYLTGLEAKP